MTDCPGSCNTWWRNLTPTQQDASETSPRQGDPVWCHPCTAAIRWKLSDLDYQYAWLAFTADGHRTRPGEPASANIPSPSRAADEIADGTGELWNWEDAARKELGLPASFHTGTPPEIRSKVIAWLTERLDTILKLDMAEDFGREINARHWRLLGWNNAQPPRTGLVNCPRCGDKLAWLDGRDGLQCEGCHRPMDAEEYEDAVRHRRLEHAS